MVITTSFTILAYDSRSAQGRVHFIKTLARKERGFVGAIKDLEKKFHPICRPGHVPFDELMEASHRKYRRTRYDDGKH
jgi:hypothetical protein